MLPIAWERTLLGFLNGDLKSHPEKKLIDHLVGTAKIAEELIRFHGLDQYSDMLEIASITHDLGKADKIFQEHLKGGKGVEHSAPSSFFTLAFLNSTKSPLEMLLAAEAVRRHHTGMQDWDCTANYWSQDNFEKEINLKISTLIPDYKGKVDAEKYEKISDFLWDIEEDTPKEDYWFNLRMLLSLLVAADRMDAINQKELSIDKLPQYNPKKFTVRNAIDVWRYEIAESCYENARHIAAPGIFCLTLPTGAGKTNIGLRVAYDLAKKFSCNTIIYAMPFISIIEQNADFAKQIFGSENVQEDHSLALYADGDEFSYNDVCANKAVSQRMRSLFRYWNAPVVITTIVQMWSAIFNPKAGASMDFHRFKNAVVIIDEPQSINISLWHQFGKVLDFLHKKMGTIFILMTATQPHIGNYTEIAPLSVIPVDRHKYRIMQDKYQLSDLPMLLEKNTDFKHKSGLIILNTKKSAYQAFKILNDILDAPIFLMSRWMSPSHRRKTLNEISKLRNENKLCYLVATQVVESGVDVDFDWVFRDIAPLDSIIQAAGRCNRNGQRETGILIVAEILNNNGKSFASSVYDSVVINKTKEILQKNKEFMDKDVSLIISEYYKALVNAMPNSDIWEKIVKGKWGTYSELWKESNYDEFPVYVDTERNVDAILEQLREIRPSLENRMQIKALQNKLDQYLIGVSKKEIDAWQSKIVSAEKLKISSESLHKSFEMR